MGARNAGDGRGAGEAEGASVLLAEDVEANILLYTTLLGSIGCTTSVARTGAEAVARASTEAFDLVLVDIGLPDIDGLEVTRKIRADGASAESTIHALTANDDPAMADLARRAGATGCMLKPVAAAELLRTVRRTIAPTDAGVFAPNNRGGQAADFP